MKKLRTVLYTVTILFGLTACGSDANKTNTEDTIQIVTTNFPGYDFVRGVVNDGPEITMLLKPGQESHSYDPSPQDIIKINEADLFIYVGGESDQWVDKILDTIDNKNLQVLRMMDFVNVVEEEYMEGMQIEDHEEQDEGVEYDEHIWTSPKNAIKIITAIKDKLCTMDSNNKAMYEENSASYIGEINALDEDFRDIVSNAKRKELIFGDRFPFRYFVEEYGLTYYAAFPGCVAESEASAQTIAFLIDKVKENKIPVVFHIELSSETVSETIHNETDAKVLLLHSVHNITSEDFKAGKTYVDYMKENAKNLKEALQ